MFGGVAASLVLGVLVLLMHVVVCWCACGVVSLFVMCRHQSPAVLVPALRTVGNIVTGNDMQTQVGVVLAVAVLVWSAVCLCNAWQKVC